MALDYRGDVQHGEASTAALQRAADDLAERLQALATGLALSRKPARIRYGDGRIGDFLKRRSPKGFLLDAASRQMLLPDGRLWSYSRGDANRFPAGRFYDARADYAEFARSRIFPGGREFIFLGAVLGKYTFGFARPAGADEFGGLCAICGEGRSVRYVPAAEAFAAFAESAVK